MLRRHPDLPGSQREEIIAQIAGEHRRLVSLLDALQALARGDAAGERPQETFDLAELLDAAVHAARRRHPLLRVHINECPDQADLHGWPDGVRSIIDNLLQNAACHAGPQAQVELALRRHGDQLTLTIADDGRGVPETEREQIFKRFVRGAAATAPGSGLGLAVVAQQVALHHGVITVTESPLGGAKFEVVLPAPDLTAGNPERGVVAGSRR
jgi:two-component system sensor histidine kinase PrrB